MNNQICKHCGAKVFWMQETPFDRGTFQHMCQQYLDALRDPFSGRVKPTNWKYIPKDVPEQRKGFHISGSCYS